MRCLIVKTHIIISHSRERTFFNGFLPNGTSLIFQSGTLIVESQFIIILAASAEHLHHLFQHMLVMRQQILLITASIVEAVERQRLFNEMEGFVFPSHLAQHRCFQGTCLMVVPVVLQAAVKFIEGILKTQVCHRYLGSLEIAGISPGFVPCGFPEQLVGFLELALIFQ